MTKVARRSPSAEKDLQDIAFQVAMVEGRVHVAERLIDELILQANNLAQTSTVAQMGTAAPELGEDVRLFSCKGWVFVFRYTEQGVDILRIVDGSQDYLSRKLGF